MVAYSLVRARSSAAEFHARVVPDPARAEVWVHELDRPALVLGSTQRDDIVDDDACAAAGVDVVRRRSGGGVVLLRPGEVTWVDVIVPAGAPGWAVDVHRPMRWLGHRLGEVLADLLDDRPGGPDGGALSVHEGALVSSPWSQLVCFDGLGPGEITLAGSKLVGISQRRTRQAARLQCCWYSEYDPAALVDLLAVEVRPPVEALAPVATVAADIASSLAERLPAQLSR